jgi:UDP-2-acetamido-3-amino-2,3-dideoxy-glucuronate N-acetyltransferase
MIDASAQIHERAHVSECCSLGAGSKVWQFASVIRGAKLGARCNVGSNAIIDGAELGDRCTVGHGASIHPGFKAGNDVFIGPGAMFCNDMWPRVSKSGFDAALLAAGRTVSVSIEDEASIGAGAIILPGVIVGRGAMVAAGAVVDHNVPALHLFCRGGWCEEIDVSRHARRIREAHW